MIVIAVLFQFQHERNFWGNAWACIRAGTSIGALAAVSFWLMLRRGAILSPIMSGAATGRFTAQTWMQGIFWFRTSALQCCALWPVFS